MRPQQYERKRQRIKGQPEESAVPFLMIQERKTKMNFYQFMDDICAQLQERLGEQYVVMSENMRKGSGPEDYALSIRNKTEERKSTVYFAVEKLYKEYQKGLPAKEILDKYMEEIRGASHFLTEMGKDMRAFQWDNIKDCVYPAMVWTERKQELLSLIPHRRFLDLSVTYIIRRAYPGCGSIAVRVTTEMANRMEITEEELYRQALENMEKDQYEIKSVEEIFRESFGKAPDEEAVEDFAEDDSLLVLTNGKKWYGAAGLLLGREFFRKKLGERNYYVIPSSIHEALFVPADSFWERDEVQCMLRLTNQGEVSEDEWLNDHLYFYNGKTGEIEILEE